MTRAILLVDHGSRREQANALLDAVAEQVRERAPDCIVQTAHLDLAHPTIAEGIDACVAAGAGEIVVHPYFLGPGSHTTRDIPERVAATAARHPELRVRISDPLGLHAKLVDVILERVEEASS